MASKKVVLITYYFPPYGGGGVYRNLSFAKYLPEFGWEPVVVAPKPKKYYWAFDSSLLDELPENVHVFRTTSAEPFYLFSMLDKLRLGKLRNVVNEYLFIPDDKIGWIPSALLKAVDIAKSDDIKVIYTSSPPHSVHLTGYLLKKLTGKPWVADFRDQWTQQALYTHTYQRGKADAWLEKSLIQSADHVIANTPRSSQYFVRSLGVCEKKVTTITNGFDRHDFEGISQSHNKNGKFTITYTGGFYGDYSPEPFFSALQELFRARPALKHSMKTIIAGTFLGSRRLIEKYRLNGVVELRGHLPHHESIRLMVSSHVLLLALPNLRGSSNWVPGKAYEYMASGKPILAIAPYGDLQELIAKSKTGFVVEPGDPASIAEILYKLFSDYEGERISVNPDWHLVNQFERKNLTETLSRVFNRLV